MGKIIPKGKNNFCKDCDWIRSQELLGRVHKRPRSSNDEGPPPILDLQTRKVTLATSGNVMRMTLVVSTKFWFNFRDLVYR